LGAPNGNARPNWLLGEAEAAALVLALRAKSSNSKSDLRCDRNAAPWTQSWFRSQISADHDGVRGPNTLACDFLHAPESFLILCWQLRSLRRQLLLLEARDCHAREGGHPVTRVGAIKAEAVPFIRSGDYWIVRLRGR
jgi:hypothetical protein